MSVDRSPEMPVKSASMPVALSNVARPIIKWAGGKTRLLSELLSRAPKQFGRYYEPFCGGAALFFALQPSEAVLGDVNVGLIGAYRALSADRAGVVEALVEHDIHHSKSWYLRVRDAWNTNAIVGESNRAAAFIYLVRAGFNGLWRVNSDGEFNVPMGDLEKLSIDDELLDMTGRALSRAVLRCGDYRTVMTDVSPGDFAYLDPPYDTEVGFTSFAAHGFGWRDQQELAEYATSLRDRGVHVMLSNSNTKRIRKLYAGWRIERVFRPGTMNSNPSDRGKVAEVIITPKPQKV